VERWAREVIPRLRSLRPDRYVALGPRPALAGRPGQAWEQLVLPARAAELHASVLFSPANLAPLAWPRNVIVMHDAAVWREPEAYSGLYRAWHSRFGRLVAQHAAAVIAVSEFSRRELVELVGLDPARVVVIGGGVDARFTPEADHERVRAKLSLGGAYVLTVGTADRRKNVPVLGELARRLRSAGLELVWAGDSRGHIRSDPASVEVRALGYVAEDDLPGLYAGARAFVLASRYEGLGLPCVEAMASGVPVVAANRAALPETCGGAAVLVDPDDVTTVAEQVIRVATDGQLAHALRHDGLRRAATMTWDRTASAIDELLTKLTDGLA
jgi:glycosyltransferase involved in cell wall biosynthesis